MIKILISCLKNIAIFGIVFIIVLFSFALISIANLINSPNVSAANIHIANASSQLFNIQIRANNEIVCEKELKPKSDCLVVWDFIVDYDYEIKYAIGDAPVEFISLKQSHYGAFNHYILLDSKAELIIESTDFN